MTNAIKLYQAGSEDKRVGINWNTGNPEYNLDVNGTARISNKLMVGDFDAMFWNKNDQYLKIAPVQQWATSGHSNCQGMTSDGSYIYLTYRSRNVDTDKINIAKLDMNNNMAVVTSNELTEGHYNMLDYYDGFIYASGAAVTNGSVDYTKCMKINPASLTGTLKEVPNAWGIGINKFWKKVKNTQTQEIEKQYDTGVIVALYVPGTRQISFYQNYIDDSGSTQVPLARITLDYTGCTTIQGTFHMTNNYIWVLETAYSNNTNASGFQVIRCFSYSGMLIKSLYIDGVTTELQDLYVQEADSDFGPANNIIYINDRNGVIYRFETNAFYHTIASNLATSGSMKTGTVKHVYFYPPTSSSLNPHYTFSGKSIYSLITMSDFMFKGEISNFITPMIYVNGAYHAGAFLNDFNSIVFEGAYTWGSGASLTWIFTFSSKINSTGHNYQYYLSNAKVRLHDTGLNKYYYNVSSSTGDLSDTGSGTMGEMFNELMTSSWFNTDIYISGLSYICGVRNTNTNLNLL